MVGRHHRLNGHEFEPAPEDSQGQGSLACNSAWGRKESDTTERLNNNLLSYVLPVHSRRRVSFPAHARAPQKGQCGQRLGLASVLGTGRL